MTSRAVTFLIGIALGLVLTANTHLNITVGDLIFKQLGIPAWTKGDQSGLHLSILLGLLLLIVGVNGAIRALKPKYPRVTSRILICILLLLLISPYLAEKSMFLIKSNETGLSSIAFAKNKTLCDYSSSDGNKVTGTCNITIFNYGKTEEIRIAPVLPGFVLAASEVEFSLVTLKIAPNTKQNVAFLVDGKVISGTSAIAGHVSGVNVEVGIGE